MAAHTASGQPLHTNPPCFTRPATRKFMHVLSMGSPPSSLSTRRSAFTPPGWLFEWGKLVNLTKFCLSAHHCRLFPGWTPPPTRPGTGNPCQMEKK